MARCQFRYPNGKRCKAHRMAGSKFCLFHTPGQKMKRIRKKSPAAAEGDRVGYDSEGRKKFWRRTTENQIAVRGSKALGTYLVTRGTLLKNKPDYTVIRRYHAPRYNRQGRVMVGGHWQRTIEPTTSDYGRNYQQTDHAYQNRKRKKSARMIKSGRMLPVLGYGYMAYNIMGQPTRVQERRPGEGWVYADAAYAAEGLATEIGIQYADGGPSGVIGSVKSTLGISDLTKIASGMF